MSESGGGRREKSFGKRIRTDIEGAKSWQRVGEERTGEVGVV